MIMARGKTTSQRPLMLSLLCSRTGWREAEPTTGLTLASHFNVNEERDYTSEDPEVMRLHEMWLGGDDVTQHSDVDYEDEVREG